MSSHRRTVPVLVVAVLLTACGESSVVGDNEKQAALGSQAAPDALSIAQAVPGFGGYFLDAQGRPAVYLVDGAQRPAAAVALEGFLKARGFSPDDLQVLAGRYDYLQLDAWHRLAYPHVLTMQGAISSDLDEGANQLRFRMQSDSAVAAAATRLAALGIPADAVVVERAPAIVPLATTLDGSQFRPVVGGIQVNFFFDLPSPVTLLCTLGFNAMSNGERSFVTNSHCTNLSGDDALSAVQTRYYQPLRDDESNFIGTEADDPLPITFAHDPECPPGLMCRYSDASRGVYVAEVASQLGAIARPEARDPAGGSLVVDSARPQLRITAKRADPVLGEEVDKIGRTTGWTFGRVTATCQNIVTDGTFLRLCQAQVAGGSGGGDSGSPVFALNGVDTDEVTLVGLLWGGAVDGSSFVFSPMSGVERELGELQVH